MIARSRHTYFFLNSSAVTRALLLGGFLLAANAAQADPTAAPSRFESALTALAHQGSVGFIVEGVPCPSFATAKVPQSSSGMLSDKVHTLAAAYDYDVQASGTLFVLRKRYANPHDLPPVSLEECKLAAEDVKLVLSALSTNSAASPDEAGASTGVVTAFAPTLTAAQVQALSSNNPLTVADLTPEQQAMMSQVVAHDYVARPARHVAALLPALRQASQSALRNRDETGQPCFGLEVSDDSGQKTVVPLGKDGSTWLTKPTTESTPAKDTAVSGSTASTFASPTLTSPTLTSPTLTLAQLAERLTAHGPGQFQVEHCLADVPVTVAGIDALSPTQVFQAVADLYGLRLTTADEGTVTKENGTVTKENGTVTKENGTVTKENGTVTLMRPLFRIPLAVGGVSDALRHVLPLSLLTAMHCDPPGPAHQDAGDTATEDTATEDKAKETQYQQQEALCRAAIRCLWSPVSTQSQNGEAAVRLPVAALTAPEQQALAVALMTPLIELLNARFFRQPPTSVAHFDQLRLIGGPYWNINPPYDAKFSLGLAAPNPVTHTLETLASFDPITIPASVPNPNDPSNVPTTPPDAAPTETAPTETSPAEPGGGTPQ